MNFIIIFLAYFWSMDCRAYQVIHIFPGNLEGAIPTELMRTNGGVIYGTTRFGGNADAGTVFNLAATGAVTIDHRFTDGSVVSEGVTPNNTVVEESSGNLIGYTGYAGAGRRGTVFRRDLSGHYSVLHAFGTGSDPNEGALPEGRLLMAGDGSFYGITQAGGAGNAGTLFRMSVAGQVTVLHSFGDGSTANDGRIPIGSLVASANGTLFGVTSSGGEHQNGIAFKIQLNGRYSIVHQFTALEGSPRNLVRNNGPFFGSTLNGGSLRSGSVFKMTGEGVVMTLRVFTGGSTDGRSPGPVTISSDGNLYGMTREGGVSAMGILYFLNPRNVSQYTIIHHFSGGSDGASPDYGVLESDGYMFGATSSGGSNNFGTIFKTPMM